MTAGGVPAGARGRARLLVGLLALVAVGCGLGRGSGFEFIEPADGWEATGFEVVDKMAVRVHAEPDGRLVVAEELVLRRRSSRPGEFVRQIPLQRLAEDGQRLTASMVEPAAAIDGVSAQPTVFDDGGGHGLRIEYPEGRPGATFTISIFYVIEGAVDPIGEKPTFRLALNTGIPRVTLLQAQIDGAVSHVGCAGGTGCEVVSSAPIKLAENPLLGGTTMTPATGRASGDSGEATGNPGVPTLTVHDAEDPVTLLGVGTPGSIAVTRGSAIGPGVETAIVSIGNASLAAVLLATLGAWLALRARLHERGELSDTLHAVDGGSEGPDPGIERPITASRSFAEHSTSSGEEDRYDDGVG